MCTSNLINSLTRGIYRLIYRPPREPCGFIYLFILVLGFLKHYFSWMVFFLVLAFCLGRISNFSGVGWMLKVWLVSCEELGFFFCHQTCNFGILVASIHESLIMPVLNKAVGSKINK